MCAHVCVYVSEAGEWSFSLISLEYSGIWYIISFNSFLAWWLLSDAERCQRQQPAGGKYVKKVVIGRSFFSVPTHPATSGAGPLCMPWPLSGEPPAPSRCPVLDHGFLWCSPHWLREIVSPSFCWPECRYVPASPWTVAGDLVGSEHDPLSWPSANPRTQRVLSSPFLHRYSAVQLTAFTYSPGNWGSERWDNSLNAT